MKESTFIIIFLVALFVIGIVGKLMRKESFAPTETSFFDRLYRGSALIGPIIAILALSRCNYYRGISDDVREKNHIPCIDTNMQLDSRTRDSEIWLNKEFRTDTIYHEKEIDIDMMGIYSETDRFINRLQNQTLVIYNRVSNLFRSHQVSYKLLPTANYLQGKMVEPVKLNSLQADSLVKSWDYTINYECK